MSQGKEKLDTNFLLNRRDWCGKERRKKGKHKRKQVKIGLRQFFGQKHITSNDPLFLSVGSHCDWLKMTHFPRQPQPATADFFSDVIKM